jgi:glycosyltransferase involved in cell wall biosynthesis
MKVLMLSKACVVGAYQRKLEELATRGVDLTVVVPPYWKDSRGIIPLEKKFLNGYRMIVAPMRFNGHFHIHYYPSLPQHLQEIRPDIIHVDEEPWDFVTYHAIANAQPLSARPLFFTWQNLLRRYPLPFSNFEQYSFRHCTHAIAGNAQAVSVLRTKGYRGEVSVIPQFGVDPEIFISHAASERRNDGCFTIAYAGRLVPEKGLDTLLRASAQLQGEWQVRLLGSGPEKDKLQQLAIQLCIDDHVTFEPQIPSAHMPKYYSQVDVLVLPSRRIVNWMEQFGRVLIEAMACRVPVVGSDSGEIPNTIGNAGLTFPEDDVDTLHERLSRLMRDEQLRRQLGERGRARVLAQFTQASVAQRTAEVYRKMMSLDEMED